MCAHTHTNKCNSIMGSYYQQNYWFGTKSIHFKSTTCKCFLFIEPAYYKAKQRNKIGRENH